MTKKDNLKKNFIWNSVGSFVNSFISLFFMIIVTRINGIEEAGIFTFAFSLACLFQVIGLFSGRTFQVTNNDKKITNCDFLYNRIYTSTIMIICAIVFLLFKNYSFYKNTIILLLVFFRFIESISDSFYGMLQQDDCLYKVGISLFLKGIFSTIMFFIIDITTKNVILSILSIVVVNLIFFVFYDYKNAKRLIKIKKYDKKVDFKLIRTGMFIFGVTFLTQYILNAPKYEIDRLLTDDLQAFYGIIAMPATIIILCSQMVVQPFLMKIKSIINNNNIKKLNLTLIKISLFIISIGLMSILLAWTAGVPVLKIIYGVDISKYLIGLLIILSGSTFYSISFLLSTVLTAYRKTFVQIVIFGISSLIAPFLSNYLIKNYSIIGASYAYLIIMFILLILYLIYYSFYITKKGVSYE